MARFNRREISQQPIKVVTDSHGVSIEAKGYGDSGSADGHGSPIFLELYRGRLRLLIWADINVEDPTHVIDLAEAQENAPLLRARLTLQQAGLSRLQEGRVYLDLLHTPNPTTCNNYTLNEVTAALGGGASAVA